MTGENLHSVYMGSNVRQTAFYNCVDYSLRKLLIISML
jgi:hypothetical protein